MLPLEKYHLITDDDELGPVLFMFELSEPFYTDVFYWESDNHPRDPEADGFLTFDAKLTHADHVKLEYKHIRDTVNWHTACNDWVVKESNRVKAAKENGTKPGPI